MAKPTGAIRNLDCEYFFFFSKDAVSRQLFRMAVDLQEAHLLRSATTISRPPCGRQTTATGSPALAGSRSRQAAQPGPSALVSRAVAHRAQVSSPPPRARQ